MAINLEHFIDLVRRSELVAPADLASLLPPLKTPHNAQEFAESLVSHSFLTKYQVEEIARGRAAKLRLGNYLLVDKIGEGGMGTVYKAQHVRMNRNVAVKILTHDSSATNRAVERFEREIRIAGMLAHDNIVVAHDAGFQDDVNFLVMEYVDGLNLAQRIRKFGTINPGEALNIIRQAAEGLAFAHRHAVVHRDIKPSNLMVDSQGLVRILDMGLARVQLKPDSETITDITNSGVVMGTIDFLAPEQAIDVRQADPRSDIYSLGCTFFFLLTGRPIFDGQTVVEKILAHQNDPVPSLKAFRSDIVDDVERIYIRMTAKEPDHRYQSMDELLLDISRCEHEQSAVQPLENPPSSSSAISLPIVLDASTSHQSDLLTPQTKLQKSTRKAFPWPLLIGAAVILFTIVGWLTANLVRQLWNAGVNARDKEIPFSDKNVPKGGSEASKDLQTGILEPALPKRYDNSPSIAVVPFDRAFAGRIQEEWANYLSVPIEWANSVAITFRLIPPGEFEQGATPREIESLLETDSNPDFQRIVRSEGPRHRVQITHPVFVGTYEVTVAEYSRFSDRGRDGERIITSSIDGNTAITEGKLPIRRICWHDAVQFCNTLSQKEGLPACYNITGDTISYSDVGGYRLLTEAEWEFCCRAGTDSLWYSTDDPAQLMNFGWLSQNSEGRVHVAGQLQPNAFGLYDMHGNVWEFCNDYFGAYTDILSRDPLGPIDGTYRILRGGSWSDDPSGARSANRGLLSSHDTLPNAGFRIAIPASSVSRNLKRPSQ